MGLYHIIFILREGLDIVGILYFLAIRWGFFFQNFAKYVNQTHINQLLDELSSARVVSDI